jgi:phosphoenolpyruvate carboxykinase (GTP)
VLDWICRRLDGEAGAVETPIGAVPRPEDLDLDGLPGDAAAKVGAALSVDPDAWRAELPTIREHFDRFGDRLPAALRDELAALERRLDAAG